MDGTESEPLDRRIDRLERMLGDLRSQVERLDGAIAAMGRSAPGAQESLAPTNTGIAETSLEATPAQIPAGPVFVVPPPPPTQAIPVPQVLCPRCKGGNPPGAPTCMWCGTSMQVVGPYGPVPIPPSIAAQSTAVQAVPAGTGTQPQQPDVLRSGEFWLSRVGIVLFLLGMGFLFKYSVDNGWLTEWARVVIGLVVGAALLGLGASMSAERRALKYILLGGSIATFYITGFAAYQLLDLVPYAVAFTFMVGVTLLAFMLSLGYNQSLLSLVGIIGGLSTPFLLGGRDGGAVALVAYTSLLAAGGVAVYLFRGWYSLLWTTFVGTWLVLLMGLVSTEAITGDVNGEKWALQAGVIFSVLIFWALPLMREWLWERNLDKVTAPPLDNPGGSAIARPEEVHIHALAVLTPLIAIGFSRLIWGNNVFGEVAGEVILGAVFLGAAWSLRPSNKRLAYTHAVISVILLTLAVAQPVQGNVLMLVLAAEAAALHYVAHRLSDKGTAIMGHILWAIVTLWLGVQLATDLVISVFDRLRPGEVPVLNAQALTYLTVTGLTLAASFVVRPRETAFLYRAVVHLAVLGIIWRELVVLPNGNAYVSVAWGIWACVLLYAGIRLNRNRPLLYAGASTLVLLVGKLFLADLVDLDPIWRVLLFLGMGGLFLALSYYFQNVMKRTPRLGEGTEGPPPNA